MMALTKVEDSQTVLVVMRVGLVAMARQWDEAVDQRNPLAGRKGGRRDASNPLSIGIVWFLNFR